MNMIDYSQLQFIAKLQYSEISRKIPEEISGKYTEQNRVHSSENCFKFQDNHIVTLNIYKHSLRVTFISELGDFVYSRRIH